MAVPSGSRSKTIRAKDDRLVGHGGIPLWRVDLRFDIEAETYEMARQRTDEMAAELEGFDWLIISAYNHGDIDVKVSALRRGDR